LRYANLVSLIPKGLKDELLWLKEQVVKRSSWANFELAIVFAQAFSKKICNR
jgi:hypothetical protein